MDRQVWRPQFTLILAILFMINQVGRLDGGRSRQGKRTQLIPPRRQALWQSPSRFKYARSNDYRKSEVLGGLGHRPGVGGLLPSRTVRTKKGGSSLLGGHIPAPTVPNVGGSLRHGEFVAGSFILTQKALDEAPYRYGTFLTQVINLLL